MYLKKSTFSFSIRFIPYSKSLLFCTIALISSWKQAIDLDRDLDWGRRYAACLMHQNILNYLLYFKTIYLWKDSCDLEILQLGDHLFESSLHCVCHCSSNNLNLWDILAERVLLFSYENKCRRVLAAELLIFVITNEEGGSLFISMLMFLNY